MLTSVLSVLGTAVSWVFSPISLALLAAGVVWFYRWYTKDFGFWASLGVPGPKPTFPWGTERMPFLSPVWEMDNFLYKYGKKFCGYMEFYRPVLYVGDPDLIRAITIKDFDCFINRRELVGSEEFKGMLSVMKDKEWKDTRSVMSPSFSASKLKGMHQLCIDNADKLNVYIKQMMDKDGKVECKDSFGRFTMDNIASCAFGVNCNSFLDPNTEFASKAGKLFEPPKLYGIIRLMLLLTFPKIAFKTPDPAKEVADFFIGVIKETMKHREKEGSNRRDFLQLLMETKDNDGKRILSDRCILDQSMLFFIAGYDTTATLLSFAAYSMATSPECQSRAQDEIDQVLESKDGKLTYEAISEMTYLDRVLSETLRLYPPATRGERISNCSYTLPGTDVTIPKGTVVQYAVFPLHRDPDHYPEPLRFDPDRFLPEVKETRHSCTYLPFGSGPRNCIAMRFALFEAKVALVSVLKEFTLVPCAETPAPPMQFDPKSFMLTPEGRKLFLKAELR